MLELIIRRDLDNATPGPFSSDDLLCISEVGIASPDVLASATFLTEEAGVLVYGADPGTSFSALGDTDGLLILVSPGRAWFPTTDRLATPSPISVEAVGDYGSVIRTHQGNLSGTHFGCFGVSGAI